MLLKYIGLAEFVPELPQDRQRLENGDIINVADEAIAEKLLKNARWEKHPNYSPPRRSRRTVAKKIDPILPETTGESEELNAE